MTRDLRITDSTLRDGSHAMRHRFTEAQVRQVVAALDMDQLVQHQDGPLRTRELIHQGQGHQHARPAPSR